MDKDAPDLEEANYEEEKPAFLPQKLGGSLEKENTATIPSLLPVPEPVKQSRSIKPGPLTRVPPSLKEWKTSGKRGLAPVAYEIVIKDAPNHALEYELYHGFKVYVPYWEVEQRIGELEKPQKQKSQSQRYTRAAIYYLQKKLEEYIVGERLESDQPE